jgi:ABC-type dipeptide/oligopeptide/nickel transport system permease component
MNTTHIIGVFDSKHDLLAGIEDAQSKNFTIDEIYTPYPVMEAIDALKRKSQFTTAAFLYGFAAVIGVLAFLYYTSVIDWPINYGGKPTNAFPSFIIITLVLTILTITILSLFTFSIRARIYPGKKYFLPDERATDDKFIILFDKKNAGAGFDTISATLKSSGASEVYEKEF